MRSSMSAVLLLILMAPAACATGIIKKSNKQLSWEAEIIALVRVKQNQAAWDAQHRLIWTTTDLEVVEIWKGKPGRIMKVTEPGGLVPPIGLRVAGMARYRVGELAVVFLKRDVLGQWRTHGAHQGRVPVDTGQDGVLRPRLTGGKGQLDLAAFKARVLLWARTRKGR